MFTFKYAVRTLRRWPGFFAIAVATIALGIDANTAIFSVVTGVVLKPLPFPDEAGVLRQLLGGRLHRRPPAEPDVRCRRPFTFSSVALLMLVVGVMASYIPSRRALRGDPIVALRAE